VSNVVACKSRWPKHVTKPSLLVCWQGRKEGWQVRSFEFICFFMTPHLYWDRMGGTWWHSWLGHCATSRKVVGLIPYVVTGVFHWHNPSGHTMGLGLTHPLPGMSTRNISCVGKGGRCVGLTTLPPSCADCHEIWEPQLHGTLRACPGL
jgi:hypothetical protein